jgi:probable F420-dependent oxidoreductase
MAMVAGTSALADAYGERLVLGMGASHPHQLAARGHDHGRPVATMREYLAAMDEAQYTGPAPSTPIPRLLGALRPPILELARESADGAHPYFVTAEHTARAREILGLGKILAPELWVLLETDPERARALSRDAIARYLTLAHHTNALLWLGFSEEDFQDGGSDRLVDALVAWGDEDSIRERVREHLEAGATHVCIQPVPVTQDDVGLDQLRRLAPAVVDLEVSRGT